MKRSICTRFGFPHSLIVDVAASGQPDAGSVRTIQSGLNERRHWNMSWPNTYSQRMMVCKPCRIVFLWPYLKVSCLILICCGVLWKQDRCSSILDVYRILSEPFLPYLIFSSSDPILCSVFVSYHIPKLMRPHYIFLLHPFLHLNHLMLARILRYFISVSYPEPIWSRHIFCLLFQNLLDYPVPVSSLI